MMCGNVANTYMMLTHHHMRRRHLLMMQMLVLLLMHVLLLLCEVMLVLRMHRGRHVCVQSLVVQFMFLVHEMAAHRRLACCCC